LGRGSAELAADDESRAECAVGDVEGVVEGAPRAGGIPRAIETVGDEEAAELAATTGCIQKMSGGETGEAGGGVGAGDAAL
jgi:hypothetical protein